MKKTALITGASSGIGEELAHLHAQAGDDLVIVARRAQKLEVLKEQLERLYETSVYVIVKDLTESTAAQEVYDKITNEGIFVDYLVNNAGFGGQGEFNARDRDEDKNMILLNIMALTELTKLFLHDMVIENRGKILNVSSTASFFPGPLQAVYFATKAYVQSFTNAIAYELKDTNVTVTNLMPGATETEFAQSAGLEGSGLFSKTASVKIVAQQGYRGMMKGKLDVISGVTWFQRIVLCFSGLLPKRAVMKEVYDMQKM